MHDKKHNFFFEIIIPNYNNIAFIKRCFDSILSQTFQDFHITVVDDVSSDLSNDICKMYANKYNDKITFIQLSHKRFAGGCRNIGISNLENSQCKYVWFIDGDDMLLSPNSLQSIYDSITSNDFPDCIYCNYKTLRGFSSSYLNVSEISEVLNSGAAPWKYVIKKEFIGIKFPENVRKSEDVIWFLQLADRVKTIASTPFPVYQYNDMNIKSLSHTSDGNSCADVISIMKSMSFSKDIVKNRMHRYENELMPEFKDVSTNSFNDLLKNSFVISYDDVKIRMLKKIFDHHGMLFPRVFQAMHNKDLDGPYNCSISHVQVIRAAKAFDLPFVVIFEDDVYPCIDVMMKVKKYLSIIPKDANIVILGWSNTEKGQEFIHSINRVTHLIGGSHSYIVFKSGYDEYLNAYQKNPKCHADMIFRDIQNTYIINIPLFIQYSSKTSMNSHIGYIFKGDHAAPPDGFLRIEDILK